MYLLQERHWKENLNLLSSSRTEPGRLAHILGTENEFVPFVNGLALIPAGPISGCL